MPSEPGHDSLPVGDMSVEVVRVLAEHTKSLGQWGPSRIGYHSEPSLELFHLLPLLLFRHLEAVPVAQAAVEVPLDVAVPVAAVLPLDLDL